MNTQRTLTLLFSLLLGSTLSLAQTTNPPRLGVNTTSPQHTLDVNGAINIAPDSAYRIDGKVVLQVTGNKNLFIGSGAGQSNTMGGINYFSGYQAGQSNTTGSYNHFSGKEAGFNNTTGRINYFSGYEAGYSNTTGETNHFSGNGAGHSNTTGNNNVYIGFQAGFNGNFTNAIAIGYQAIARANNTVTIGNGQMTSIGGYQPWSNLSDGRFKREVSEDVPGLDFVTRLRPVSYRVDRATLQSFLHGEEAETKAPTEEAPRETGFIAQEVEEVAKAIGYEFSGIITPQSERDHYQLSYATFVVPLVRAVQEQQAQIEALQAEVARLNTENTQLQAENATQQAAINRFEQVENRLQALESLYHLQTSNP